MIGETMSITVPPALLGPPLEQRALFHVQLSPIVASPFAAGAAVCAEVTPRLLTMEQAARYCGVCPSTFKAICTVAPIALRRGERLLRYDVRVLDRWIDGLKGHADRGEHDWLSEMDRNDVVGRPN